METGCNGCGNLKHNPTACIKCRRIFSDNYVEEDKGEKVIELLEVAVKEFNKFKCTGDCQECSFGKKTLSDRRLCDLLITVKVELRL